MCGGIPARTLYRKHTSVMHPKLIDAAIDRNHGLIGNAVEFEKRRMHVTAGTLLVNVYVYFLIC